MNQATPAPHGQGGLDLTPSDIFFILFRHKTKIVLFALLGITAGATVYKFWPEEYQSNAKLLVRYVTEKRDVVDANNSTVTSKAGGRDSLVLDTELAIINSLDLAERVAQKIDPTVFGEESQNGQTIGKDRITAIIKNGITAEAAGRGSNIINLVFSNENPAPTPIILQEVIDSYLDIHVEIHRSSGGTFDEHLSQQTDQLRARLNQTEKELLSVLSNAGLIDIVAAKQTVVSEISRMQQLILDTELELSISKRTLEELRDAKANYAQESTLSEIGETDSVESNDFSDLIEEYENARTLVDILKSRRRELLLKYTPENGLVKGVMEQLSKSEKRLAQIESEHPSYFNREEPIISSANTDVTAPTLARVRANEYRLEALNNQLGKLKANAKNIEEIELKVNELQRRKRLEEANYNNFLISLEKSRIDEALSDGKINNITILQKPTPPSIAVSDKYKFAGGVLGGIAAIGLAWAFLFELFLDRTIKRPIDIQRDIGLPLFMTIPDTKGKAFRKLTKNSSIRNKQNFGKGKAANAKKKSGYTPKSSTLQAAAKSNPEYYGAGDQTDNGGGEITPWDVNHPLHNYFEALRDKVISYFESKNLQHKPKLIGLTGLGEDPGVSTVASGVASSLSKTEGGNVLLVDMTLGKESAHQFYKGKEVSNLEEALLEPHKAQLQDNLYVVAEGSNGYKLPSLLPNRFNSIIPKLKASDFDYIVFDMPAVSPISSTPRLASFMDVMLLVIESENTNKDVVKQAAELLSESKAHLGAVLNKTKSYVPRQLEQDFIGLS